MIADNRDRGMYPKYRLFRMDENGRHGEMVTDPFFVLRYTTDPHAAVALAAFAKSCERDHPKLAADLREALRGQPECECDEPACQFCDIHGETGNPPPYDPFEPDCKCIDDKTVSNYCGLHGDPTNPGGDCK